MKFPSRYSESEVSASQYITELICEKKAQKQKKELPHRFWELPEWKVYFKQQIIVACGLLKIYHPLSIIKALKHKESWGIYSLRSPQLDNIIKAEERIVQLDIAKQNTQTNSTERCDITQKPRPYQPENNSISKLKALDDE